MYHIPIAYCGGDVTGGERVHGNKKCGTRAIYHDSVVATLAAKFMVESKAKFLWHFTVGGQSGTRRLPLAVGPVVPTNAPNSFVYHRLYIISATDNVLK
jgi:hypothetical protein